MLNFISDCQFFPLSILYYIKYQRALFYVYTVAILEDSAKYDKECVLGLKHQEKKFIFLPVMGGMFIILSIELPLKSTIAT